MPRDGSSSASPSLVGRQVVLTSVDTGEYHVFVVDAATPAVTVMHPAASEARAFAAKLAEKAPLRLSVPDKDGLLVAQVFVERWSAVNKILTVNNASPADLVQRRATFRVPVALAAQVAYEREGQVLMTSGHTVDVSERGLAFTAKGVALEGNELAAVSLGMRSGPLLVIARVILGGDGKMLPSRCSISQIVASDQTRFAADLRQAELNMVRTVVGRS